MLKVTNDVRLADGEIHERFVRAAGSGGQNRDREATAVELRLDIARSSLPPAVKARLIALAGRHVSRDGVLIVVSREYRSQARNREAARRMLTDLLASAAAEPARRVRARKPRDGR